MRRAVIDGDGRVSLGDQAERAGYVPGQLVDVLVTSAGSLIISLSDDVPVTDAPFRVPLPQRGRRLAISGRRSG